MNHVIAHGSPGSPGMSIQDANAVHLSADQIIAQLRDVCAARGDRIAELERRISSAEFIMRDNVTEMTNKIGGVEGYVLDLDEDQTRKMWKLLNRIP